MPLQSEAAWVLDGPNNHNLDKQVVTKLSKQKHEKASTGDVAATIQGRVGVGSSEPQQLDKTYWPNHFHKSTKKHRQAMPPQSETTTRHEMPWQSKATWALDRANNNNLDKLLNNKIRCTKVRLRCPRRTASRPTTWRVSGSCASFSSRSCRRCVRSTPSFPRSMDNVKEVECQIHARLCQDGFVSFATAGSPPTEYVLHR